MRTTPGRSTGSLRSPELKLPALGPPLELIYIGRGGGPGTGRIQRLNTVLDGGALANLGAPGEASLHSVAGACMMTLI